MKDFFWGVLLFLCVGVLISCEQHDKLFRSIPSDHSGIDFVNRLEPTDDLNILSYLYYYNGAGVAIGDFNNDQLNDIYFTSNQGSDKLYLNRGNLHFEDVTEKSGIGTSTGWATGVTHADINSDGLLDIYVCQVGGYKNLKGKNKLYINKGARADGIPSFEESAHAYGLDFETLSTQSAFFDYDLDGDLDMFLLTHSVYPNRSYGSGDSRLLRDSIIGDKLLENINGKYVDVTASTGIFQNRIGYGLGLATGDLDRDGYPDIYIGNDFFENDYCFRNNGNKTFTELISSDDRIFGHTSHYSMGNCMTDINNDGLMDIISLDMLPEDLVTLKSSGVEDGYPIYHQFLKNGYAPQFMQNTLHVNRGKNMFSEVAFQSGIAATEWSWGVLGADLDMDGLKDLYITNGIVGATNEMDYINFISQENIQRQIGENGELVLTDFIKHIPQKKVNNYAYRNSGDESFENATDTWFDSELSFSNGSAYGDLDNDGDLDLVVNNINDDAFVFENRAHNEQNHFLKIRFSGSEKNTFGIGAKVEVYAGTLYLYEENFPVKSFLSSVPNEIVIGLGSHDKVDSLRVIWPDNSVQTLSQVSVDKIVTFSYKDASVQRAQQMQKVTYLKNTMNPVDFRHREESTLDFDRDPLVPFALSNEGPGISVADVNGDGRDDVFISGGKRQPSQLLLQDGSGEFRSHLQELFQPHAMSEDLDQVFFDADNDNDLDIVVVAGGNEFTGGDPLKPRLYLNQGEGELQYAQNAFSGIAINASMIEPADMDNDGDTDLIICSNALPGKFGETAHNRIFINDGKATFKEASESFATNFQSAGLVNDLAVADLDGNGFRDLIVVGDWMPLTLFFNDGKVLSKVTVADTEGWWNAIAVEDFDKDGDFDIVAGNWGMNSRLKASAEEPVELYRADFDDNGTIETIITYYYKGKQTVLSSKDELHKQMPFIKKKFQSYRDFAEAEIGDLFPKKKLNEAVRKEVKTLSTCYFDNNGKNNFNRRLLPGAAQNSTVNDIFVDDFNNDGFKDLLLAGNNYELSTQLGRLDASHGVLLLNDQAGFFKEHSGQQFNIAGPARDIERIVIKDRVFYIVGINGDYPIFLEKQN